ncbi:2OG-Fe(II) oxygenase [Sphingomonas sp. LHG3443-2]|uniref:2OG-Fe(II) oxygenase n=1 Tax=Sphingomonas sp. LHG3443-2 TaxID=2804639 RepID=UPI003CE6CFE2
MTDVMERAADLASRGQGPAAVALLRQLESAGNPEAARQLAVWYLSGRVIPRDLTASRNYFMRAAELGDRVAAGVSRAFIANGTGGPADWPLAMTMLRSAADADQDAATQLRIIDAMSLDAAGQPTQAFESQVLHASPNVWHFPGLFTKQECSYCKEVAGPLLEQSLVVDPATGRQVANPIRTSQAAAFPFVVENPAIHALNRRLAAASDTYVRAGEPLQILRYSPGEEYRLHSDALPGVPLSQQRVLTFLVYLNDDYEGGETAFPNLGLTFKGATGDGLLFTNTTAAGELDTRSLHEGRPVLSGTKYLASRWIRSEALQIA